MNQEDIDFAKEEIAKHRVDTPSAKPSELSAVLSRIETLEKRVHDLEAALENSRPALQAAGMFIPIGGNGQYVHKQEPLGEPFATILNDNLDELYER